MSDSPAEQVITEQNVMKFGDPNDRYAFNSLSLVAITPLIKQVLGINISWLPVGTPYTLPKHGSSRCGFIRKKNKLRFTFYIDADGTVEELYHYVAYDSIPPYIGEFDIDLKTDKLTNVYTCSEHIVSALKMYIKFMSDAKQHDI